MQVSKSFFVIGSTKTYNGEIHRDLATKVDKCINDFLDESKGKFVSLTNNVQIGAGAGTDLAFLTVIVDIEEKKKATEADVISVEAVPVKTKVSKK